MLTIKLVVIGASGVGKTSLRGQYISGRFSDGYRATIGADFITKKVPHPNRHDELITLQIWDTAGQERFSSLSTAFFRGADAVLMMFDVNDRQTMHALSKWWAEFRDRAPVSDEDAQNYCCVVVGNKIDLHDGSGVQIDEAHRFVNELIPGGDALPIPTTPAFISHHRPTQTATSSYTIYHTPSSSLFDVFYSARSSPEPRSSISTSASPEFTTTSISSSPVSSLRTRARSLTARSFASTSSGSAATITPARFARDRAPPPLERGPKLFFASAKTGAGVPDVFEYIAARVLRRWEHEERIEAGRMHILEGSADTVRLQPQDPPLKETSGCCGA
ncbi:P-loop containing nucleoside triphosphate hydrolase protein [Infundibulicybe gibba]|nr:P-loop containing nucleoside triphosphate hydrolase protein [Infundibulicybe gibba]